MTIRHQSPCDEMRLQTLVRKRFRSLIFTIVIFASFSDTSFTASNSNQQNINQQQVNMQQSSPFNLGLNIHCACDNEKTEWNIAVLTPQQYNNIRSVIGYPPAQIPVLNQLVLHG